ncbi:MAG TPA: hypothetical protein VJN92_00695 [Candidatus Acidoferrum sp.]|nr:hypothetical protein [Candidatus Acidoferrum sp.]
MALIVPSGSLHKKTWIAVVCALAFAWMQAPVALAQHGAPVGGGHVGGGHAGAGQRPAGGPVSAPHAIPPRVAPPPAPPISRPPLIGQWAGLGQRVGLGRHGRFAPGPIFIGGPIFHRAPFFRLRLFYPNWWTSCGSAWVWGFGCGDWRPPECIPTNYVTIYESPVYVYYEGGDQLVELFLKDGTVYSVTDYWFVNDQVHFTALEEDGAKSAEQVIGLDELDLQKTIDVNTRRGFRVVRRDEPMEQYLRDHPEANAPLLEPPPKN